MTQDQDPFTPESQQNDKPYIDGHPEPAQGSRMEGGEQPYVSEQGLSTNDQPAAPASGQRMPDGEQPHISEHGLKGGSASDDAQAEFRANEAVTTSDRVSEDFRKAAADTGYAAVGLASLLGERARNFFDDQQRRYNETHQVADVQQSNDFLSQFRDQLNKFVEDVSRGFNDLVERGRGVAPKVGEDSRQVAESVKAAAQNFASSPRGAGQPGAVSEASQGVENEFTSTAETVGVDMLHPADEQALIDDANAHIAEVTGFAVEGTESDSEVLRSSEPQDFEAAAPTQGFQDSGAAQVSDDFSAQAAQIAEGHVAAPVDGASVDQAPLDQAAQLGEAVHEVQHEVVPDQSVEIGNDTAHVSGDELREEQNREF